MGEEQRLKNIRVRAADNVARIALFGGSALTPLVGGGLAPATRRYMQSISEQYETVLEGESEARERLATTFISIGDGVIVMDAVGRIVLMNPVAEALTGWTDGQAAGHDNSVVFDITHEETGVLVSSPIERAIREGKTVLLANHTVLKRRDGDAAEAGQSDMMLGASANSVYARSEFRLEVGDMIVFTTDGITEARRGRREFFGYEGFTRAIREASHGEGRVPLAEIAASVVSGAKSYAGGRLNDDVCLLLARRGQRDGGGAGAALF